MSAVIHSYISSSWSLLWLSVYHIIQSRPGSLTKIQLLTQQTCPLSVFCSPWCCSWFWSSFSRHRSFIFTISPSHHTPFQVSQNVILFHLLIRDLAGGRKIDCVINPFLGSFNHKLTSIRLSQAYKSAIQFAVTDCIIKETNSDFKLLGNTSFDLVSIPKPYEVYKEDTIKILLELPYCSRSWRVYDLINI